MRNGTVFIALPRLRSLFQTKQQKWQQFRSDNGYFDPKKRVSIEFFPLITNFLFQEVIYDLLMAMRLIRGEYKFTLIALGGKLCAQLINFTARCLRQFADSLIACIHYSIFVVLNLELETWRAQTQDLTELKAPFWNVARNRGMEIAELKIPWGLSVVIWYMQVSLTKENVQCDNWISVFANKAVNNTRVYLTRQIPSHLLGTTNSLAPGCIRHAQQIWITTAPIQNVWPKAKAMRCQCLCFARY